MICPDCGTDNATGAEWCTRCQFRFGARPSAPPPPSPARAAGDDPRGSAVHALADPDEPELVIPSGAHTSAGPEEQIGVQSGSTAATVTAISPAFSQQPGGWGGEAASKAEAVQPVRKGALFPSQSQATAIDPSWVSPGDDYGTTIADEVTRIGRTSFRFMLLGAAILLLAAALPTVVYSVVNIDGTAVTGLLYMPLDVGVAAFCGIFALLGRKRLWASIRLAIIGVLLVGTVAFRYVTYGSIAVNVESAGAQSVRLGPGWYLMVFGGIALGVAWIGAVRGRLE